jgi:hypothetical protein
MAGWLMRGTGMGIGNERDGNQSGSGMKGDKDQAIAKGPGHSRAERTQRSSSIPVLLLCYYSAAGVSVREIRIFPSINL